MITYDTLRELAHTLSKVTGYRYVAFRKSNTTVLFILLSDSEMAGYSSKSINSRFWSGAMDFQTLNLRDIPNLDWSKCQFDCEEKENEEETYRCN